ncbi:hypothetical protein, partial [Endozoicomonas sp. YOMI1]|uniref:hypothetical protein n=1 Tax=Endozoicomonas sp. YOMI1 TaxID=2828739 RepID=UPI0021477427
MNAVLWNFPCYFQSYPTSVSKQLKAMNSASNHTDFSFTCPICLDDDGITTGQSAGYTLVGTSCQPKPHVFHLGCITKWLDGEQQQGKRLDQRQCCECRQPALPL